MASISTVQLVAVMSQNSQNANPYRPPDSGAVAKHVARKKRRFIPIVFGCLLNILLFEALIVDGIASYLVFVATVVCCVSTGVLTCFPDAKRWQVCFVSIFAFVLFMFPMVSEVLGW